MKVIAFSVVLLIAVAAFVCAQGRGIVNKIGQEQAVQIVSGLTNGMPAREVESCFTKAGIQADIGWRDRSNFVSAQGFRFTNSGTHTVRWIDRNSEPKSAEQPNTGSFVVQFTNGFIHSAYVQVNYTKPTELGSNQSRIMIKLKETPK
jgi:hypothetical protein